MDNITAEKIIRRMLNNGIGINNIPAKECLSRQEIDALNKAIKALHKIGSKKASENKTLI